MTRETKVGLLAGLAIILLIGIIVSDYLVVPTSPVPPQVQQFASQTQDNIHPPSIVTVPQPMIVPVNRVEDPAPVPTPRELTAPPAPRALPLSTAPAPGFSDTPTQTLAAPASPAVAPVTVIPVRDPQTAELQRKLDQIASPAASSTPVSVVPPSSAASTARTITVEEGDTLYQLAADHLGSASRYEELYRANRDQLSSPSQLKVGMKLRLPSPAANAPVSIARANDGLPAVTASPVAPADPKASKTYTVKASDTLYSIAQSQLGSGGRWREIYQLNRQSLGDDEDALKVGQTLKLPPR